MASAKLTLEEVDDRVHTHDMKIETTREYITYYRSGII